MIDDAAAAADDDYVVVSARTNLRVWEQSKPINTFSHKLRWGPDIHKPTTQKRQKGSLQKGFRMFAQQQQRTICTQRLSRGKRKAKRM